MQANIVWHGMNDFAVAASVDARLAWYLKHAANCGCTPIPGWAMRELASRGIRLPIGYDEAWQARGSDPDPATPVGNIARRGAA